MYKEYICTSNITWNILPSDKKTKAQKSVSVVYSRKVMYYKAKHNQYKCQYQCPETS